jgi:hypothetical protein
MASIPIRLAWLVGHVAIGGHKPDKPSQLRLPNPQGTGVQFYHIIVILAINFFGVKLKVEVPEDKLFDK